MITLACEQDTLALGAKLASAVQRAKYDKSCLITLSGPLGAGKTSFARGFLQQLGYQGRVKSPTYTLVESYECADVVVDHFDLYRLKDPQELLELGWRDYFIPGHIVLVEWPERAESLLPKPDVALYFDYEELARKVKIMVYNQDLSV